LIPLTTLQNNKKQINGRREKNKEMVEEGKYLLLEKMSVRIPRNSKFYLNLGH
jgi:hypothetical protein